MPPTRSYPHVFPARLVVSFAGLTAYPTTRWVRHVAPCWVVDLLTQGSQKQRIADLPPFVRRPGIVALYAPQTIYHEHQNARRRIEEAYMLFKPATPLEQKLRLMVEPAGYCFIHDPDSQIAKSLPHIARLHHATHHSDNLQLAGHLLHVLGLLMTAACINTGEYHLGHSHPPSDSLVQRVRDCLQTRIYEPISVTDLAQCLGMKPSTFAHAYRRLSGQSPYQAILTSKIHEAKRLLLREGFSVQQTAEILAFSSPFNFSRAFKQVEGCAPSHYADRSAQS